MMLEERINQYDQRRASEIELEIIDVKVLILLNHATKNERAVERSATIEKEVFVLVRFSLLKIHNKKFLN